MFIEYDCEICGKHMRKQQSKNVVHRFCSTGCKAEWQRRQKPVGKEWLYQKYIVEGLDCTQISKLVNRNSKQVWNWIKDYGIPTRSRGKTKNYLHQKQPSMLGKHHSPETREKIRQARYRDGRVPYLKNGVHYLKGKRGAEVHSWKGGITAERQAFYSSIEWKAVIKEVWRRDNATCQRCKLHHSEARKQKISFDIHHIVSFAVRELRCELSNLVLLCEPCHYWVHGTKNDSKEFIRESA